MHCREPTPSEKMKRHYLSSNQQFASTQTLGSELSIAVRLRTAILP